MNLGIAFGAGLYEARIVAPLWAARLPHGFSEIDSGRRFWGFVTTLPLTLLCFAGLYLASGCTEPVRTPWLAASLLVLAERLATFGYFIPTIVRLQRGSFGGEGATKFAQWRRANLLRNGLTLLAWIAALRALTLGPA